MPNAAHVGVSGSNLMVPQETSQKTMPKNWDGLLKLSRHRSNIAGVCSRGGCTEVATQGKLPVDGPCPPPSSTTLVPGWCRGPNRRCKLLARPSTSSVSESVPSQPCDLIQLHSVCSWSSRAKVYSPQPRTRTISGERLEGKRNMVLSN